MQRHILIFCMLFAACKKENSELKEACDVHGMNLDGQYALPIEYDHLGRVSAYSMGTDRVTIDYSDAGHIYFYRNKIYYKAYHLNSKGLAASRTISLPQTYDSVAYEYDEDGFLIKEVEGYKVRTHVIVNGDRILTLERFKAFSSNEYIDSIRYFYNSDSLAYFYGGDRFDFLGKKYTHRLKQSVRTSNHDSTTITKKYLYEYHPDGKLQLIREISSGGIVGSNTGWYIYWRCE